MTNKLTIKALAINVLGVGALIYWVATTQSFAYFAATASDLDWFRTGATLGLCLGFAFLMTLLWRQGRIPFGFFLIVLGGFFLGVASRSPSPSAELNAGLGFALFVGGYLTVRIGARNVSIETTEPVPDDLNAQMIERLLEAAQMPVPRPVVDRTFRIQGAEACRIANAG